MIKRLIAAAFLVVMLTAIAFAQTPGATQYPGSIDSSTTLPHAADLKQSTLSGAINAAVTTFSVASGTPFSQPAVIWIDSEQINCTTLTTATFSGCTRGAGTSTASAHLSGAAVQIRPSAVYINGMQSAIIAIQTLLGTNAGTQPAADKVMVGLSTSAAQWQKIANAQIDPAAAISYSKLNLTSAILNADLAGSIANAKLANSTISGVSLGSNLGALTIGTGLSGTSYNGSAGVTIAVNTSQNIATLSNLTTNGFVKTGSGTGALSVDTSTYLTGNQTVTLSGDVTGSGATSITTTVANIPSGAPMAGSLLATNIAAPSTPASGKTSVYVDSTTKVPAAKNDAGTVSTMVIADTGSSNNFLTAISAGGVISKAQPTDANLSTSDITTNDVSTSKHGFAPKLPNDATKYLDGTGAYSVPAGGGGGTAANPTASVGLSAVNGSASTFMRSDGAPALSQTIAPTWTGVHTFSPSARSSGVAAYFTVTTPADTSLTASTASPGFNLATGTRQWATGALTEQFEAKFNGPTYGFVGASTCTRCGTLYASSPIVGTNATFTAGIAALFEASAAAHVPLVIRGASSQSGDLLRFVNSSNTILTNIRSDGTIFIQSQGSTGTPAISISGSGTGIWVPQASDLGITLGGATMAAFNNNGANELNLASGTSLGFGSSTNASSVNSDTVFTRKAARNWQFGLADAAAPGAYTLSSQSVVAGTTNTAGVATTLIGSLGTSQGVPGRYHIQTGALIAASGTTQQTAVDRLIIGATKVLTNNSATTLVNVTDASNTSAGGTIEYSVEVTDGTDIQNETGVIIYTVVNKGGVFSNNTITTVSSKNVVTAGTLAVTFTISAANPAVIQVNANSSLTPSTGYPRITYSLKNYTQQAVAVQ